MLEDLEVGRRAGHLVLGPHLAELGADRLQPPDEPGPGRLAHMPPVGGAQLRNHPPELIGAVQVRMAARRMGEAQPERVALCPGHADHGREERGVGGVPGQQVEALVDDAGRKGGQPVEDLLDLGDGKQVRLGRRRSLRCLREPVEVLPLRLVEPERAGHRVEDLAAGVDRAALLEPGVPRDADARELGHLLTAQPGGAAPEPGGKAGILRRYALPAAAQERGELGPPGPALDGRYDAHSPILAWPARSCQVVLVPG